MCVIYVCTLSACAGRMLGAVAASVAALEAAVRNPPVTVPSSSASLNTVSNTGLNSSTSTTTTNKSNNNSKIGGADSVSVSRAVSAGRLRPPTTTAATTRTLAEVQKAVQPLVPGPVPLPRRAALPASPPPPSSSTAIVKAAATVATAAVNVGATAVKVGASAVNVAAVVNVGVDEWHMDIDCAGVMEWNPDAIEMGDMVLAGCLFLSFFERHETEKYSVVFFFIFCSLLFLVIVCHTFFFSF